MAPGQLNVCPCSHVSRPRPRAPMPRLICCSAARHCHARGARSASLAAGACGFGEGPAGMSRRPRLDHLFRTTDDGGRSPGSRTPADCSTTTPAAATPAGGALWARPYAAYACACAACSAEA
eukprot:281832-Chlamydomonas_euryale.AAC.1